MPQEVIAAISASIAGCAFIASLVGLIAGQWRNSKKDTSDLTATWAELKADVKYIRDSID